MTDTATQPDPTIAPAPAPVSTASGLSDSLNTVLKTAPELAKSPGVAVSIAASGGDTQARAQSIARGTNAMSDAKAAQSVSTSVGGDISHALNWFGNSVSHVVSDVAAPVGQVVSGSVSALGKVLNAPLAQVQHDYRYLHDVEARHGFLPAVLEGLGMAAGAVGGFAAGGIQGAVLGAEGASTLESQVFYRDSYARTQSGSYTDPHNHDQVSIGRDVASLLGLSPGSTTFKLGSGVIDGIADMGLDPIAEVGSAVGGARSAEGAAGKLGDYFSGTAPVNAEDIDRVYNQYPAVRRAFGDIAGKTAGEIIATPAYNGLRQIAKPLGAANSAEDVAQVFKDAFRTQELAFSDQLPSLAFTRLPFQAFRETVENMGGPAGKMAQNLTRLPESFDSASKSISGSEFDPSDPVDNGALGIYRMLRFAETRRTAASVVDEYINAPDLGTRIQIYRNATLNTLFSMAHMRGASMDDVLEQFTPQDRSALKEQLDNFTGGGSVGQAGVYGLDDQGKNISLVKDTAEDGRQYSTAITDNQTGKLKFIPLSDMRHAASVLKGGRGLFGRADDFMYDHVTQGLFKPLVLLTPSYAEHISLAELIPNMLRTGVGNIVKSGIAINMARLGAKADEGELNAIQGVAWRLIGATRGVLPERIDAALEQRLQLASRYIEYNGGHFQPLGLASGHNYSNEVDRTERSMNLLRKTYDQSGWKTSDTFTQFGASDERYMDSWQSWLREIANDPKSQIAAERLRTSLNSGKSIEEATADARAAVSTWLHQQPDSYLGRFTRSIDRVSSYEGDRPMGVDSLDDWAGNVVANVRGATRAANLGIVHDDLLEHIASGKTVEANTLDKIAPELRPSHVKGREIVPSADNFIQRVANSGFTHVLNPMVNFLSRQPIAFEEFEKQYSRVSEQVEAGLISEDEAMPLAMSRTVNSVIRNVHNLHDRTQWTVTFRNWAPFYFAQEQAYRRFGRLLAQNPGAFRRYQMMISNIHDVGQVLGGQNGQSYFVIPGTGWLTSGTASVLSRIGLPIQGSAPVGMGFNLNSTSVIFPLSEGARPGLGPVVAIPMQAFADIFPEAGAPALKADVVGAENFALGGGAASSPIWQQLIPNVIMQRALGAAFPAFNERAFNSSMMQTLQTLDYEGKIPPAGAGYQVMQDFMNRVRNQTRLMYAVKALVGAATPVSPEVQVDNFGFPDALTADIKKEGSVAKGITTFLEKNPLATPYTVFQSGNPTGASIAASVEAENWINQNTKLIHDYPNAALYLMPQLKDTVYNATVYNEQLAQGLRQKYTPGTINPDGTLSGYMAQLYIAAGNATFFDKIYPKYQASIAGATGSEKYNLEQTFYNVTIPALQSQNPVWGTYWAQDNKAAQRNEAVTQLKDMFAKGDAPANAFTDQVKNLMTQYQEQYVDPIAVGSQDSFAGEKQSQITANWQSYLQQVATNNPQMRTLINGVFYTIPTPTNGNS